MRDLLPHEHNVFASALPEIRAHFEQAAVRSPDHHFVLNSVAEEMRHAERQGSTSGIPAQTIERARSSLIAAAEGKDYYPMVAHEFDVALEIALSHQKRLKSPGL